MKTFLLLALVFTSLSSEATNVDNISVENISDESFTKEGTALAKKASREVEVETSYDEERGYTTITYKATQVGKKRWTDIMSKADTLACSKARTLIGFRYASSLVNRECYEHYSYMFPSTPTPYEDRVLSSQTDLKRLNKEESECTITEKIYCR